MEAVAAVSGVAGQPAEDERAALELLQTVLGATILEPPRCEDCGAPGVGYDAPPDAAGVFCFAHARRLPVPERHTPAGDCHACGAEHSLAFWFRRDDGTTIVRRCCPEHAPPRTPGGRPADGTRQ